MLASELGHADVTELLLEYGGSAELKNVGVAFMLLA